MDSKKEYKAGLNILFIGHYDEGSTSGMRGVCLQEILKPSQYTVANIDIPINATNRLFRSIGWRYKKGPLIKKINTYILLVINNNWAYDIVWVEKGVFIRPSIIEKLSKYSDKLIHFTPDPAFTYHRSDLFNMAVPFYDHCITTKIFEKKYYTDHGVKDLIICTQGFDPDLHKPYHQFREKKGIVFIGHREDDREKIVDLLLTNDYQLTIAGNGWSRFAKKNRRNPRFTYLGKGVYGKQYAKTLSSGLLSLGLLSRIIPELHTTRTFEIPACGTALVTESNTETRAIFNESEAIFFNGTDDLLQNVKKAFADRDWLEEVTNLGYRKVTKGGYDYKSIISNILDKIYGL